MKTSEDLLKELLAGIIARDWIEKFELKEVKEKNKEFSILLVEKEELVPKEIKKRDWVLNGYCRTVELLSFPLKGKATYIKIKKRRWKIRGESKCYTNSYDLYFNGVKATKEFALFLKELSREEADEFFLTWPDYGDLREKDTSLVQRISQWFQR